MRYDAEHKTRTRHSILTQAAHAIRSKGAKRIGVAEVMTRAGLTHGGFYAHFKSKDELVAAAVAQMFEESQALFRRRTENRPPAEALARFVDVYLSPAHRDARDSGCPLAALSSELPHLPPRARTCFDAGAEQMIAGIADLLRQQDIAHAEALARSVTAEMVGALLLARTSSDARRSDRILRNSRDMIKARLSPWSPT